MYGMSIIEKKAVSGGCPDCLSAGSSFTVFTTRVQIKAISHVNCPKTQINCRGRLPTFPKNKFPSQHKVIEAREYTILNTFPNTTVF